ncbi:hypothetical protein GCM10010211_84340 [Streptomyces albospinus]|uniref:Uncharacterized protein n=1 Tax=Streptomyces albospinus TaxID=285515 RepID=A0ABQ2VPU3_9ACTN|nr:hypothetical protein [Streptomyces albospinus]GGV04255.1 hypothetical protein GCM10010211_84340 [Streptomyces albospinus]
MSASDSAAEASRLIGFGLRPKLVPSRDEEYRRLVRRFRADDEFAAVTAAVARGLDLVILEVTERTGVVVASTEESVFAIRMSDYARRTGGEGKAHERVLHALAHLGAAALAFPRPADLADESYLGRITVEGVEAFVRQAATALAENATAEGEDTDPSSDRPGLETVWRVYARRARTGATGDGRKLASSTTGIVSKAVAFLADQGLLVRTGDARGGTYRTTPRYRVQVREAGAIMFEELLALGITAITDGTGTLAAVEWAPDDIAKL